jgi:pimeloyl-ACP methyl ester carboxylesterase
VTESVIVAHGLWMPGLVTEVLCQRLKAAGFRPRAFRFPTLSGTLGENAERLRRFAEKTPGDTLHFVGHSLGGVVILTLLAQTDVERAGRIVCLGSPFAGSRVAAFFTRTRVGRAFMGKSLTEHLERGGMRRWDGHHELGIIAGTRNLGFGRIVVGNLPDDNDGTVAVEETRLPGATAHLRLPVTHTQLLFDRAVAQQTIHFLRHGRFAA